VGLYTVLLLQFTVPLKVAAVVPEAEIPADALSSLENDPVAPLKVPANVTPPAALIPALKVLSAVKVWLPERPAKVVV
jgi:hypothetical protein